MELQLCREGGRGKKKCSEHTYTYNVRVQHAHKHAHKHACMHTHQWWDDADLR